MVEFFERKRKEERRIKDRNFYKIFDQVFDRETMLTLYDLTNKGYFEYLYGVLKTGKEANIFLAEDSSGDIIVVKIYRIDTSDYTVKGMRKYIDGDPRFYRVRASKRHLIYLWVQKEYKNLEQAYEAGVSCPRPIAYMNNIILMEYLGYEEQPYPMLKYYHKYMKNPKKIFEQIIENVKLLYCKANLVHADLSEYNVLVDDEENIYLIDFPQAVSKEHPQAMEFLYRDLRNIWSFFLDYIDDIKDLNTLFEEVTSCKL